MRGMALAMSLAAVAAASRGAALPRTAMSGMVGCHRLTFRVELVRSTATYTVNPAGAALVAITEVYPDRMTPAPVHYLVTGTGIAPYERTHAAHGFGPVTYFLRVAPHGRKPLRIALSNLGAPEAGPAILRVRGVSPSELDRVRRADRFRLMGTVLNPTAAMPEEAQVARLSGGLPAAAISHIGRAFSYEVYYASNDAVGVRAQLEKARGWSLRYRMPVLLGLVSWWNGTPLRVPDGEGGHFGDLKYQQVCYTPGAEHPENPALKALLGARYNRHYRLSVPNIWSNTPWLTLNSATLNAYRARRMEEAVRTLKEVSGGDLAWVAGIYLENEPRYWDTQSTANTPQWAGEQWADFSPASVAQAARDGVALDPADGLSPAELEWLQRNAARYFQQTADAADAALRAQGLAGRFPLYTHSLQLALLFPACKMNRTPSDWARAAGARTGLEGMWSNLSDYERVREWGPWANLNREETDGQPIGCHLWDLRCSYAAGAEYYNSYNWHLLQGEGYIGYAATFLANPGTVELAAARVERVSDTVLRVTGSEALQACSAMAVEAGSGSPRAAWLALEVAGTGGGSWFSERLPCRGGSGMRTFTFPVPAELSWHEPVEIRLRAYDGAGRQMARVAAFGAAPADLRLALDLARCRAESLLVIGWRPAKP